jgi:pseudouridine kinase
VKSKLVVCIGAALVDEIFISHNPIHIGTSNPSNFSKSVGGVARNIAGLLAQLNHQIELITHVGNDPEGDWILEKCREVGIGVKHSLHNEKSSGRFLALLHPNGELHTGASYSNIETEISPEFLLKKTDFLKTAVLLVIDCNLSKETIDWLLNFSIQNNISIIVEPVSLSKSKRMKDASWSNVLLYTPNEWELDALDEVQNKENQINNLLKQGLKNLWIRSGKNGSTIYNNENTLHLAASQINIIDSTGAGDAALAGWIHGWLLNFPPEKCLQYGHTLANMILQIKGAELENLNHELLDSEFKKYHLQ